MVPRSRGRTGRPWVRARQRCLATGAPCCLCGRPIDYGLPYRDPVTGRVNVWSASAHHVAALARGGDPYDILPAHLKCNRDAGVRDVPLVGPGGAQLITSREW